MKNIYHLYEPIIKMHCMHCRDHFIHNLQLSYSAYSDEKKFFEMYINNDFYEDSTTYKLEHRFRLYKDFINLSKEDFKNNMWFSVDFSKKQLKEAYDTLYKYYYSNFETNDVIYDDIKSKVDISFSGKEFNRYYIEIQHHSVLIIEHDITDNTYSIGCSATERNTTQKEYRKYWRKEARKQLIHPNTNYLNMWFELEETHFIHLLKVLNHLTQEN